MVEHGFLFYRPVAPTSAQQLYEITSEALASTNCVDLIPPERMHLSLLHRGMLRNKNMPDSFVAEYSAYDICRRHFATRHTAAWETVDIALTGVKAYKNSLVVTTHQAHWLNNERRQLLFVNGIPEKKLNFKSSEFCPHISLGKFIAKPEEDIVSKFEQTLTKASDLVTAATLEPLHLKYGQCDWVFQSRYKQSAPEVNINELANV